MNLLKGNFYSRDSNVVAKELLGKILVKGETGGRIVETEAYYGPDDPASHASSGRSQRNEVMFGPAGRTYVYLCYGMYYLLNITTRKEGEPGAVLIRAIEPRKGIEEMKERRGTKDAKNLTNGPGKLTMAMDIDKEHNNIDITKKDSLIKVLDSKEEPENIGESGRIGISEGEDMDLRFFIESSDYLSN